MHTVIDTPWDCSDHAPALKASGVRTVLRYYNHANSTQLPQKRLSAEEAATLAEVGLSIGVVFQQRGGANGHIDDLTGPKGARDAKRSLQLAASLDQPEGSAIYFAVDHDYWRSSELARITPYFEAVAERLRDAGYRVGVYGSGKVARTMLTFGHVDLIWLAAATGWSGTKDMLKTDDWALFQKWPPVPHPVPHDGNVVSPAWHEYGQFVPGVPGAAQAVEPVPNSVIMEVIAKSGLTLRGGPGKDYDRLSALPMGSLVHVLGQEGRWKQVDLEGDGGADGFMHGDYLRAVSGGLPVSISSSSSTVAGATTDGAYAIARQELALDIQEVPGAGNNPRIVTYHNSTTAAAGTDDSVPWCSSFVNYCVEQAGITGTNSQWALSWKDWGVDASDDPREGDIVVFERVGQGGHVGFLVNDLGKKFAVLGGNQSNRVKVSNYPKNGKLGSFTYKLRGIRRA